MSTRADYLAAIDKLVQGEIPLDNDDKYLAIGQAVKKYSRDKPREVIEDEAGSGAFDYAVSGLDEWSDDFSSIRQVEYPVDDDDRTANILDDDGWMIYEKPAGKVLRFTEDTPVTGESIRITYTALHTCSDSACTIPGIDEEAVQLLAAAYFLDMLAVYHAQDGDASINADAVAHDSRAAEYASRAARYRKQYNDHVGVKDGKPKPACHIQDQDVTYPGGQDRLTHSGRYR